MDKSISSLANNFSLNPLICSNALRSQKIKDPAIKFRHRLRRFQAAMSHPANGYGPSNRTVLPPARQEPERIVSRTSAKSSRVGCESASTKINHSPEAAAAPEF